MRLKRIRSGFPTLLIVSLILLVSVVASRLASGQGYGYGYRYHVNGQGQQTGGGDFSPADLNPLAWWDGTDTTTLFEERSSPSTTPAIGDPVGTWQNKVTGSSWDLQALADVQRGTLASGGVEVDVSTLRMGAGTENLSHFMTDGTGAAFFMKLRFDGDDANNNICGTYRGAGGDQGGRFLLQRNSSNKLRVIVNTITTADGSNTPYNYTSSQDFLAADGIIDLVVSYDSTELNIWKNGTLIADGIAPASGESFIADVDGVQPFGIGWGPGSTTNAMDGLIKSFVVRDSIATAQEVSDWGDYNP